MVQDHEMESMFALSPRNETDVRSKPTKWNRCLGSNGISETESLFGLRPSNEIDVCSEPSQRNRCAVQAHEMESIFVLTESAKRNRCLVYGRAMKSMFALSPRNETDVRIGYNWIE